MTGYWPRSVFRFMDLDFVSVLIKTQKLGQYPAILNSRLVNNAYILYCPLPERERGDRDSRSNEPDRTENDWRSKPEPSADQNGYNDRERSYDDGPRERWGPRGGYDSGPRDRSGYRGYDDGPPRDRSGYRGYNDGPSRDRSGYRGYDDGPPRDRSGYRGYDDGPPRDRSGYRGYDDGPSRDRSGYGASYGSRDRGYDDRYGDRDRGKGFGSGWGDRYVNSAN